MSEWKEVKLDEIAKSNQSRISQEGSLRVSFPGLTGESGGER